MVLTRTFLTSGEFFMYTLLLLCLVLSHAFFYSFHTFHHYFLRNATQPSSAQSLVFTTFSFYSVFPHSSPPTPIQIKMINTCLTQGDCPYFLSALTLNSIFTAVLSSILTRFGHRATTNLNYSPFGGTREISNTQMIDHIDELELVPDLGEIRKLWLKLHFFSRKT